MSASRRLAAILAANVVGYSRLMERDEAATLAALKARRKDVLQPAVAKHHGRIVKVMGDGVLVEFGSAVNAVACAVELQAAMDRANAGVAEDRCIVLRVGINLGDVMVEGSDLYGDGVNIAARLEGLSEAGGLCISASVFEHVNGKVPCSFVSLGLQTLKNIDRPIEVYRLAGGDAPTPQLTVRNPPLPGKPSIAVLPFQNMSGDPEQEFFSDGMAEEIITALSKLRWFFVIARNSTFAYKGKSPDVRQVARELGVRYVLEGSVRKAGSRVRITAQLIDGTKGSHIWAERYDREVADIFAVQDEITRSVVGAIEPQLYAAENLRIQSKPPESLDAWGCVIRALSQLGRHEKDDIEQAAHLLKRAIALSPGYAKAHSLLAVAEMHRAVWGGYNIETALSAARQHAQAALALDDDDPWSYFSSGFVELAASKYDGAIAWFRRAIEMNQNFALAHGYLAGAFAFGGQPDTALEEVDRAIRMSPRDPFNAIYLHFAAVAHFAAERYAEGVACEEKLLRERRNVPFALRYLAACYVGLEQLDKARAAISALLRLTPESSINRDAYGYAVHTRASDQERYVAALRKAGLPEE